MVEAREAVVTSTIDFVHAFISRDPTALSTHRSLLASVQRICLVRGAPFRRLWLSEYGTFPVNVLASTTAGVPVYKARDFPLALHWFISFRVLSFPFVARPFCNSESRPPERRPLSTLRFSFFFPSLSFFNTRPPVTLTPRLLCLSFSPWAFDPQPLHSSSPSTPRFWFCSPLRNLFRRLSLSPTLRPLWPSTLFRRGLRRDVARRLPESN